MTKGKLSQQTVYPEHELLLIVSSVYYVFFLEYRRALRHDFKFDRFSSSALSEEFVLIS